MWRSWRTTTRHVKSSVLLLSPLPHSYRGASHCPLDQPVCGLNPTFSDVAACFFQLGCNKTWFLPFSSCTCKTCCSGEPRPLQIILSSSFLTLRYGFVPRGMAFIKTCKRMMRVGCFSVFLSSSGYCGEHSFLSAAAQACGARGCCTDGTPQYRRPRRSGLPAR